MGMRILYVLYFWIYFVSSDINELFKIPNKIRISFTGASLITGLLVLLPIFVLLDYILLISFAKIPIYFSLLLMVIIFGKILKKLSTGKRGVIVKEKIEVLRISKLKNVLAFTDLITILLIWFWTFIWFYIWHFIVISSI